MLHQLSWVAAAQERQTHIQTGILIPFPGLIDQQPRIGDRLIIGIGAERGANALDLKEIEGPKNERYVLGDDLIRQLLDDEQVDAVMILAEGILFHVFQNVGIVAQFDLNSAGCRFMPVDTGSFRRHR